MRIRTVKVRFNWKKPWARAAAGKAERFLKSHGFGVSGASGPADATVCIGGDGTIFHYNHIKALGGAVLGIGSRSSHVCGIKTGAKTAEWKRGLLSALRMGKAEKRLTLELAFNEKKFSAINDVVIHTHDYRVITITLSLSASGKKHKKYERRKYIFEGDGLILSTPTGSPAYAYSAGGKIISTAARKIQVVPICPYKRAIRPLTVPENKSTKISVSADRSSDVIVDGIYIGRLPENEKVFIKKGKDILFLRAGGK